MRQNLNELLKREESLGSLMHKSNDLSANSIDFYKLAKKIIVVAIYKIKWKAL